MKNKKGFTLVELLVTIVVLGIMIGLSFPLMRNLQEQQKRKKYETYKEGMLASARLYVNSYAEDMFGHQPSGCAYITYQELEEKNLIKDIPLADSSCNSESTFVRVVKLNDQYAYSYYLGCGDKVEGKVRSINYSLPEPNKVYQMDRETCRGLEGASIKVSAIYDNKYSKRKKTKVTLVSPTGIDSNLLIFTSWSQSENDQPADDTFVKANFEVPKNQEAKILEGNDIQIESNDIVTPENGEGEYYLWIRVDELSDLYGSTWTHPTVENSRYVVEGPFHVDKTPPVCEYVGEVDVQEWTNENKTITVKCSDPNGMNPSGCEKENYGSHEFTTTTVEGTIPAYTIKDKAGNKTTCKTKVNVYVDKTAPTCTLSGNSTVWTNQNRNIVWGCNDTNSGCAPGYTGGSRQIITSTTTINIPAYQIRDKVGNITNCAARNGVIVNVDKDAPNCTSSGDSTAWTTGNRTITWGCNDNQGNARSGCDKATYGSQVFNTTTQTATIPAYTIKDKAGNTRTCPARVANVYVRKTYTLTYNNRSGSGCSTTEGTYGSTWGNLCTPTRSGFTFHGWYTSTLGNGTNITKDSVVSGNITVYAKWVSITNFDYTGGVQTFKVPATDDYILEVWGAQGGKGGTGSSFGGYAVGTIRLTANSTIYVQVGGTGTESAGGYNGGGSSGVKGAGGGGATHMATANGLLSSLSGNKGSIIIVAGGGGGVDYVRYNGYGSGGGYIGVHGSESAAPNQDAYGLGGSQSAGGLCRGNYNHAKGSFGKGGNGIYNGSTVDYGPAGGGGYYGGSGMCLFSGGGGGGSGYIGHSSLTNKQMVCYNCEASNATATKTISNTCTSASASSNCSKQGNGYARITRIG